MRETFRRAFAEIGGLTGEALEARVEQRMREGHLGKRFEIGGVYRCTYRHGTVTRDSVHITHGACLIRVIAFDDFPPENNGMVYTMLAEDSSVPRFGKIARGNKYFPDEVECRVHHGREFHVLYITSWHVWKYKLLFFFAAKLIVLSRKAKARVAHEKFAPGGPGYAEAAARFEAYAHLQ